MVGRLRTPFLLVGDKVVPDPYLALHVFDTLGIAPSLFYAWIDLSYPSSSIARAVMVARAYDNAYGTRTSLAYDKFWGVDLPDLAWDTYPGPGEPEPVPLGEQTDNIVSLKIGRHLTKVNFA